MSSEFALQIDQVSKIYHLYDSPKDRLKQVIMHGKRQYYREYQALSNVSFSLPKGEVLGVVGRNGAGKSTLLQLICGTLTPTSGHIHVNGRIAALLELGAGFNPQFTGRENIYLSASIMGISKQEVEQKIDDIIDYAGVRHFIDQPVSSYSSGMFVRLAFSVATSIEPDILIIDEALSVGDGDFARKSFERIMAMKERGATILFCSHSLYQIESLCSKAIWLEKGALVKIGEPDKVITEYQSFLDLLTQNPNATPEQLQQSTTITSNKPAVGEYARLQSIKASTSKAQGNRLNIISGETDLDLEINFVSTLKDQTPQVAIAIHNAARQLISSSATWASGVTPNLTSEGQGQITLTLPKLPLLKGTYYVGVLLFDESGLFLHDEVDPAVTLDITQPGRERGIVQLPTAWRDTTSALQKQAQCVSKRQPSDRWQVREFQPHDAAQVKQLYQDAFATPLDDQTWQWKYSHSQPAGYVALDGEDVAAFCGGTLRQGLMQGKSAIFCQIGDVMVEPKQRGILTKTGAFYQAIYPFVGERIGPQGDIDFAFGFPNQRALKVGEKQGIYTAVDHIFEMTWPAQAHQADYSMQSWHGDAETAAQIDQLWQQMQPYLSQHLVGNRDANWLRYRYLDKPNDTSQVLCIAHRKNEQPIGVIVLKARPDRQQMELMDFICTPQNAQDLIKAAQLQTNQQKLTSLFAWLTPTVFAWLEKTNGTTRATDIVIPANRLNDSDYIAIAKNNWWLTGGDTDFR